MRKGFTLIELSIVLVIIGLLIGSILAGKAMIRASEMRSVGVQRQDITTAIASFKDRYLAIPGEFYDYRRVWPQLTAGNTCPTYGFRDTADGLLDDNYEIEAAYAQLQAAGLVAMGRPQILSDGTVRTSWNCIQNGMLQWAAFSTKLGGNIYASLGATTSSNTLSLGDTWNPVMTVEEIYALDLKYDDGKPNTGYILGRRTNVGGYCTSSSDQVDPTVTYCSGGTWCSSYINNLTCQISLMLK